MIRHAAIILALLTTGCVTARNNAAGEPVTVGVFAFNDFHGHIEPERQEIDLRDGRHLTRETGGAARLATALTLARERYPYSVTVSAGDLIGASPLVSSLFLDEPTVAAMNMLGLDFNAVGNHEFDRGRAELLRMQRGGCARLTPRTPCAVERFKGAKFGFLAASTFTEDGATLFPATGIRRFGSGHRRVSVGVIGLTLKDTPVLVAPDGVGGLTFGDEVMAINAAVPRLKAQGADAIVVLIHQGGTAEEGGDPANCGAVTGPIIPILEQLDPRVDVVVSGHTHEAYVCEFTGSGDRSILLTSAGKYGVLLTEISLLIDPHSGRVTAKRAENVAIARSLAEQPAVAAHVARYAEAARAVSQRRVGRVIMPPLPGKPEFGPGGETMAPPLGNLIADAQLAASRSAGARIALTNPKGIRAALAPAADGAVTFGQIYAVQPFGNTLLTMTLTGAEIRAALEQGLDDDGPRQVLAASAGLEQHIDWTAQPGRRLRAITLDGAPLDERASYRVTVNSFLASGGDGFTVFAQGRERVVGGGDLDALEAWIGAVPMREVPTGRRASIAR